MLKYIIGAVILVLMGLGGFMNYQRERSGACSADYVKNYLRGELVNRYTEESLFYSNLESGLKDEDISASSRSELQELKTAIDAQLEAGEVVSREVSPSTRTKKTCLTRFSVNGGFVEARYNLTIEPMPGQDFAERYSKRRKNILLLEELEPVLGYDSENEKYGSLVNDSLAKSVIGQMRNIFASSVTGLTDDATFKALTNLGIRTELDGSLSITDKEFDAAFKDNLEDVQKLLSASTESSSSGITVNSFGKQTNAGEYDVVITTTPRKGAFTGDAMAQGFPFNTGSLSFGLNLTVNGVASDFITVPTDVTYNTESDLAAAMQSAINADAKFKASGTTVTVSFDTDHFVMTSTKYGASSNVNVNSVTSDVDNYLKIAQGNGSAGRNVSGTINGVVGFGLGQVLLPKVGEPGAGLSVIVGENATSSTVNFSRGVGGQLNDIVNNFLQSNGLLDKREEKLERDITGLEGEEERLDRRMSAYEERLMQQFIAMENILNGLNNSGSFLDNLFKSLPFTSSKN